MPIAKYAYTCLDCPEPIILAEFYSKITGWEIQPFDASKPEQVDWLELLVDGKTKMAFQQIENYKTPTWPENETPQQLHMDFHALDLDQTEAKLLEIGARKASYQDSPDRFRAYLDPAGHPFCIVKNENA